MIPLNYEGPCQLKYTNKNLQVIMNIHRTYNH